MHPTHRPAPTRHIPTQRRRRDVVETGEFAAFTRRILRAYARRVADCDIEALTDLVNLSNDLDTAIHQAVNGLRECGYSWADIAARLGIARQSAHERFGGTR